MHNQSPDDGNQNPSRGGRYLHIAHRRSPSELTPLMVEQLALQQQIEMLQAHQQQILAQQQQFAQAGLIPPGPHGLMPPPSGLMPPPPLQPPGFLAPNPNFNYPVSGGAGGQGAPMMGSGGNGGGGRNNGGIGHRRGQSSVSSQHSNNGGYSNGNERSNSAGHARRHSLVLSEAKKAAALAQAKRSSGSNTVGNDSPVNVDSSSNSSSPTTHPVNAFKFPSSPEKSDGSVYRIPSNRYNVGTFPSSSSNTPGNSSGVRTNANASNSFQFPIADSAEVPAGGAAPAPQSSSSSHERKGSNFNQHNRSGSRNFDQNWRQSMPASLPTQQQQQQQQQQQANDVFLAPPNNQFVPGHRSRGSYNSSISSLSNYGSGGGGGNQQRKSLFVPYLPQATLPGLLAEGLLVSGILRVNRKNRSDAYVSTDGLLDADIFICGSKDRNRALEGDLVAVELLEVDEVWASKREKEEKKKRRDYHNSMSVSSISIDDNKSDNTTSGHGSGAELGRRGSLKQRPTQKKNDDVEVEGQSLLLVEEEELNDESRPLYAGHVVAIIERVASQMFTGSLGLLRPSAQATKDKQSRNGDNSDVMKPADKPKIVWFKPNDKRVPLIAIPTEQAPKDFVENHEKYADKAFVAAIKRWPITSLHPFGTLVEELGSVNDLNVEIESILRDNNFVTASFPDVAISSVVDNSESLLENLGNQRTDYTEEHSIAFSTCLDSFSDQAIHLKHLGDDLIELAVHVSDVTHFVAENSATDREAKKRGVSVYLKQKELAMFPAELNKVLSFEKEKTSPSISVVFQLKASTAEITDCQIKLGVVKPKSFVSMEDIEDILGGSSVNDKIAAEHVKTLSLIAFKLRKQRLNLDLCDENTPILSLLRLVEDDCSKVLSVNIFDGQVSRLILDEINYRVNEAAAQKTYAILGDRAFLRRQADPVLSRLESFSSAARLLGVPVDSSSSASLQRSLLAIDDKDQRIAFETLFFKCLSRAKYFLPGNYSSDNYGHYLLNSPLYTHFNAPLSRYADLIVHRQIKHAITGTAYAEEISNLSGTVDYCNFKKDCARQAQDQSIHLYLSQGIGKLASINGGQIIREGIVVQVYESSFDVVIPEFGIEKRVHGDQLPLVKAEFKKDVRLLELYWEKGVDSTTYVPEDEKAKYNASASNTSPSDAVLTEQLAQFSLEDFKSSAGEEDSLADLFKGLITREDGKDCIQEIRPLQKLPIIIRAEVGKGIPCITVRAINPFKE